MGNWENFNLLESLMFSLSLNHVNLELDSALLSRSAGWPTEGIWVISILFCSSLSMTKRLSSMCLVLDCSIRFVVVNHWYRTHSILVLGTEATQSLLLYQPSYCIQLQCWIGLLMAVLGPPTDQVRTSKNAWTRGWPPIICVSSPIWCIT